MPLGGLATFACRELQAKLIDFYGKNTPEYKVMGSVSLVKWLLSPQNRRGFNQITDTITGLPRSVPGKLRGIAFAVDQPFCYDVCKATGVTCTTTRQDFGNNTQEMVYDFDNTDAYRHCDDEGRPVQLKFTRAELAKYCTETDTEYITRKIAAYNQRFIKGIDKRLGELMTGVVGHNADDEAVTNIPFFVNAGGQLQTLNPEAWWFLNQNYINIGGEDQYALVGGQVLSKIMQYQKWTGLNAVGIDLAELDNLQPYSYYDRFLDTTIGKNQFFQLSPGSAQLVTWNEFVGDSAREVTDLYTNGTWIDPDTGLEVDYRWRYDPDCQVWTYECSLFMELAPAVAGGCGIPNANGILLIHDCSHGAKAPECPADSASA